MACFVAFMIGPREPVYIIQGGRGRNQIDFCDKLKEGTKKKKKINILQSGKFRGDNEAKSL